MKIIQLIQRPQYRGAEIFSCQLSNELLIKGHQVLLVTIYRGEAQLPFNGQVVFLNRSYKYRFYDFKGWRELANIIYDYQPDIVQANAADTLKFSIFSRLIYRWSAPIVFRNASTISQYIKQPIIKAFNSFLLKKCDFIASVSQYSKDDINRLFPFTQKKSKVIPIGINAQDFKIEKIHQKEKKVIIHVGGFTFEKNHEAVLRIFGKVYQNRKDTELWLLGEGKRLNEIENLVKAMCLESAVIFQGRVDNPLDYISSADVLILPSIIEGLPGVLLESLLCKTPVVAYNVGGISEVVKHRKTGWLINKNDEEEFCKVVLNILNKKYDNHDDIISNGYSLVYEKFDMETITNQFINLFKQVINKN